MNVLEDTLFALSNRCDPTAVVTKLALREIMQRLAMKQAEGEIRPCPNCLGTGCIYTLPETGICHICDGTGWTTP